MSESNGERYSVTCPHCRKAFIGELLVGAGERHRGFKCPHCKLFVPAERADEAEAAAKPV